MESNRIYVIGNSIPNLVQIHHSDTGRKSEWPVRCFHSKLTDVTSFHILFMMVVLVFVGVLANGVCNAASNPPEVRVGSELDFPPYAFLDKSRDPAGFSIELIKAVSDTMGLSIKISTGTWDTVWEALVFW